MHNIAAIIVTSTMMHSKDPGKTPFSTEALPLIFFN